MEILPKEQVSLRIVPTAIDTNAAGDIFGGWLMSQADIASSIVARQYSPGRVVTVAVDSFHFLEPVMLGGVVSIYARVVKQGNTSHTITLEIYIEPKPENQLIAMKVAEGQFVYVHIDERGKASCYQINQLLCCRVTST